MEFLTEQKTEIVNKGTFLLKQSNLCQTVYKVVKGCLKSYVIDKAGKEHILQFAPEGWYISDIDSFINNKPASIFIEAIEETEVLHLIRSAQNNTEHEFNSLIEVNNKVLNNIIAINKRLIGLLSATAEQRYFEFTQTYPSLVQRLPLKLIASYIGITPEYLSEIRRRIAHK
jgi:CRP-like cAMP-binding protein